MIAMKTKERVFWASRRLGYRRSRARQYKLMNIAAISGTTNPTETLRSSGSDEIWEGMSQCAEEHEMALHTYSFHHNEPTLRFEDVPVLLRRDQMDGVVILNAVSPAFLDFLRQARIPTVVASNFALPYPVDQVRTDSVVGGRMLTRKLLEHGHRHIAYLAAGAERLIDQELYRGFEEVMREHKRFDAALVRLYKEQPLRGISAPDELLRSDPRPTAIVTAHWHGACQVAFAANRLGIDFRSGLEIATTTRAENLDFVFPVVYLEQHLTGMGRKAVERLMELHQNPRQKPKVITVACSVKAVPPSM